MWSVSSKIVYLPDSEKIQTSRFRSCLNYRNFNRLLYFIYYISRYQHDLQKYQPNYLTKTKDLGGTMFNVNSINNNKITPIFHISFTVSWRSVARNFRITVLI